MLCVQEYLDNDEITIKKYDISVKYGEFADASFESKLTSLTPAMQAQIMSPKMFVDKLYGDSLTEEEKKREIEYIDSVNQSMDDEQQGEPDAEPGLDLGEMMEEIQ